MAKTRRLGDLFVLGREVTVDDGRGEPITVWVQKISPAHNEKVFRAANIARSKTMALLNSEEDPTGEREEMEIAIAQLIERAAPRDPRETMLDYVLRDEYIKIEEQAAAEIAASEKWKDEDHLQGLLDAWVGTADQPGLQDRHGVDPDDVEVKVVLDQIKEYQAEVDELAEKMKSRKRRDYDRKSDAEIHHLALEQALKSQAQISLFNEVRRQRIFYATRYADDHRKLYFSTVSEVEDLPDRVFGLLTEAYNDLSVDVVEGKDSPETPTS